MRSNEPAVAEENYYALLGVAANASAEDIKTAFRQLITRYHPDKVQHLGREFQELAADRAAELTHAYTVLSDTGRRAEYDKSREDGSASSATTATAAAAPERAPAPPPGATSSAGAASPTSSTSSPETEPDRPRASQFAQERASRDEFVRLATLGRFRQAVTAVAPRVYDEWKVEGVDVAYVPKPATLKSTLASSLSSSLFKRSPKPPRLAGQFLLRVDRRAVAEALLLAGKWESAASPELCLFLIGSALASAAELAQPITEQREKGGGKNVTVIPVDARDWNAYVPTDAPAIAKTLVAHLQGTRSR